MEQVTAEFLAGIVVENLLGAQVMIICSCKVKKIIAVRICANICPTNNCSYSAGYGGYLRKNSPGVRKRRKGKQIENPIDKIKGFTMPDSPA